MVAVRTSVTSLDLSSWPSRHSNLSGLSLRLTNSVVTHEQSALVLRLTLTVCCVLQVLPSWHVDQARLFPHLHENQCARLPSRHACSRHQGQERGALQEDCCCQKWRQRHHRVEWHHREQQQVRMRLLRHERLLHINEISSSRKPSWERDRGKRTLCWIA